MNKFNKRQTILKLTLDYECLLLIKRWYIVINYYHKVERRRSEDGEESIPISIGKRSREERQHESEATPSVNRRCCS